MVRLKCPLCCTVILSLLLGTTTTNVISGNQVFINVLCKCVGSELFMMNAKCKYEVR